MSSDRPADDLEKGATDEVNPRMTTAHMIFVDVVAVLQVLFTIGLITYMVGLSPKWWTPLPAVATLLLLMGFSLSFKPKTNYAMMEPTTPAGGSDKDDDLSNKLLLADQK